MKTEVLEIGDDGDVTILHTTPIGFKSAAAKITIDLTEDDVENLPSTSKRRRRESSDDTVLRQSFSCGICSGVKPMSDSFVITGCDHSYCTQCISNHAAAKLQGNVTALNCPAPGCVGLLEPHHCRTILPKEVFDRWCDALCEAAVILGAERFYCPYKDCSALMINDGGGCEGEAVVAQSECPHCHRQLCVACKAAWHEGISCEEFQKRRADAEERSTVLAEAKEWIRCPHDPLWMYKEEGFCMVRCRCGHLFCHSCKSFLGHNEAHWGHAHAHGCPYLDFIYNQRNEANSPNPLQ